jgi:hypothetical protein
MNVVQVERFKKQIENLPGDCSRLPEALATLEQVLCRKPDSFPIIIGDERRRARLNPYPGIPPLSIFYRVDGETIYLVWAELYEVMAGG